MTKLLTVVICGCFSPDICLLTGLLAAEPMEQINICSGNYNCQDSQAAGILGHYQDNKFNRSCYIQHPVSFELQ